MAFKSGRGKGNIICASTLVSVLLLLGVGLAAAPIWSPSAVFFPQNCLYTLLNAMKTADRTSVYYEAPRTRLRDWVNFASQLCAGAPSSLKLFEDRIEFTLYARIAGAMMEKPEPDGANMVLRE